MPGHYDWTGQPISQEQWSRLFEDERHIGDDEIDGVRVSTVWHGIDYGPLFDPSRSPLIFETMIFGGEFDEWTWRYATEREARDGHAFAVALVADAVKRR